MDNKTYKRAGEAANKLTEPERLFLWRRRFKMTQRQAGLQLGMTRVVYANMEDGVVRIPTKYKVRAMFLGPVTDAERCTIYRRRSGMTQQQVANELECSRDHVRRMERGKVKADDLLWFWEQ